MTTNFRILKISHGTQYFTLDDHRTMLESNLASVHPDTKAMGQSHTTQFDNFITSKKGDIFLS